MTKESVNIEVSIPEKLAFLFESHRYKVAYGGRGSGKSWSVARVLIVMALGKKLRILCAREIQKSLKDSVHRLISDQIQALGLGAYFEVTEREIRCPSTGSQFLFSGLASNTVESIKSFEAVDICWCEEAQVISEKSWQILIPTIRQPNSEIWLTLNPELESDPTFQRFIKNKDRIPDCVTALVNYLDNPYFPEVLRIEMETMKRNDPDAYNHVWMGQCKSHGDAVVFKGKYVTYDFEPDTEYWSPFYGADFGFANDPTTFIKSWVYERTLYIEYEMFAYQLETDMSPAMFDTISGGRNHISRADCARPEIISYMKRNGYKRMMPCRKWKGSIEDGVDYIRSFDQIVIHPRCTNILNEFKLYSYRIDKLTGETLPEVLDKWNHGIDALRYSLEPLVLGYKTKISDRPTPVRYDNLGRPIIGRSDVTMERLTNPDLWMS